MQAQSFTDPPGYWFIFLGVLLAAVSAFVPHFGSAYHLDAGVLIAGLVPYAVYSVAVVLLRGMQTTLAGLALVVAHAWLVASLRFGPQVDYSNGVIYIAPLVMAVLILPLVVVAVRRPWHLRIEQSASEHDESPPG